MNFEPSARSKDYLERLRRFVRGRVEARERELFVAIEAACPGADWRSWREPVELAALRQEAKAAGLWNLFLPDPTLGAGLSNLEYAPLAEEMGRSLLAPDLCNCNAPDTGNMELLWKYGSPAQKDRWLAPLLAGEIRSVFAMTEPEVASSDATNMRAQAVVEGDEVVVTGHKWWATGLGHPRARVAIVLAHTPDPAQDRHHQHSMVLVPLDAAGVVIERMLPVFGDLDPPYGHGELRFEAVRVPLTEVVGAPGQGFAIAQGRLGPGRVHHAMRAIGAAERALELAVRRGQERVAFGKPLIELGGNRERVAEARIAIDQARLLTLHAAWKLDTQGIAGALAEVSAIKVACPAMLERVVDLAIQLHGGMGLSRDTPLTGFFYQARALRLADGPDEVHKAVIARLELAKHAPREKG
jgi:acyl-CoA dehydrogenase